jgi:hypothetical protein
MKNLFRVTQHRFVKGFGMADEEMVEVEMTCGTAFNTKVHYEIVRKEDLGEYPLGSNFQMTLTYQGLSK